MRRRAQVGFRCQVAGLCGKAVSLQLLTSTGFVLGGRSKVDWQNPSTRAEAKFDFGGLAANFVYLAATITEPDFMKIGLYLPFLIALSMCLMLPSGLVAQSDGAQESAAKPNVETENEKGEGRSQDPDGKKQRGEEASREKRNASAISMEDRERLNRLLRQVWDDPAVAQSREEVRVASENLRRVLGEKIKQLDPKAAELMSKMRKESRSPGAPKGDHRGGGSGGRRIHGSDGGQAGLDYMARPPFYASLAEEEKEIYDAAYKEAQGSDELEAVSARLDELRTADEELRKKRIQQFMQARKIIYAAMIKADPRVADLIPKRDEDDRREGSPRTPKPE